VLLKEHVQELHELTPSVQAAHLAEVVRAGSAVNQAFAPRKLNYARYGNNEPHVHWHILPRYADDPDRERNPWLHADRFRGHATESKTARVSRCPHQGSPIVSGP
jgi:diadenosine tetraphosphate (Ap4A) HIT family hydrolase